MESNELRKQPSEQLGLRDTFNAFNQRSGAHVDFIPLAAKKCSAERTDHDLVEAVVNLFQGPIRSSS